MSLTAQDITRLDQQYIWHPFTQHSIEKTIIPILRARDYTLYTKDDKPIIDCISSWWTVTHGHNQSSINQALREQISSLSHVMFAGFSHEPAAILAEKLIILNNHHFAKVFFSDNGSTATEIALKLAYQYHYNLGQPDKKVFLHFEGGYHGDTFGAMSMGRTSGFFKPFEPFFCETAAIPFPITHSKTPVEELEAQAFSVLDLVLDTHRGKIAAMIMEPILQGASGMRLCRPEFIDQLTNRLRQENILVIFDEVATGFGRLGKMFAHEYCEHKPDMLCLSKGLTAGYMPLSATLVTQQIYDQFLGSDYKNSFTHGHSFTANPLACSAAVASLDLFETDKTFEKISAITAEYQKIIPELETHHSIENPRMMGTLLAWDLNISDNSYKVKVAEKIKTDLLNAGYNMRPLGKTFYLLPPYCIRSLSVHLPRILRYIKT